MVLLWSTYRIHQKVGSCKRSLAGLLEAVFKYGAVYGYQDGKHDCKKKGMKQLG